MKTLSSEEFGQVEVITRKKARRLILRVGQAGQVRVTVPPRTPDRLIHTFIQEKADWINEQRSDKRPIESGDMIAHAYVIQFQSARIQSPKSRVVGNNVTISLPETMPSDDALAQETATKIIKKLLKKESTFLLDRLEQLSQDVGLPYESASFRQLKSRWGSCNSRKEISLNVQLMNLPHVLIDHVLLHELTHTIHMNHSQDFWDQLRLLDQNCDIHRKQLKCFDATSLVMA